MKTETVNVATLKQKLSEYLHLVEQGDEVLVTSHRRRVARLVPERDANLVIRAPTRSVDVLKKVRGVTPLKPFAVDTDLARDRARR